MIRFSVYCCMVKSFVCLKTCFSGVVKWRLSIQYVTFAAYPQRCLVRTAVGALMVTDLESAILGTCTKYPHNSWCSVKGPPENDNQIKKSVSAFLVELDITRLL